jgi:hypothetical protein
MDRLSQLIIHKKLEDPFIMKEFVKVTDKLEEHRFKAMNDIVDLESRISSRIQILVESHKCHFQSIISNKESERNAPWFMNKEPSEIIVTCFSLFCDQTEQVTAEDSLTFPKNFSTLEEVSSTVLRINTFLYGPTFQSHLPTKGSIESLALDPVILLKIFYIILMNEGFFKECMRQYHIMHIRTLRKQIISSHFEDSNVNAASIKSHSLEEEFRTVQKITDSLKLQLEAANQRHLQTEALLKQKIADLLIEVDQQAQTINHNQAVIKDLESQLQESRLKMDDANEHLLVYEVKLRDMLPTVERARLLESELANLKLEKQSPTIADCTSQLEETRRMFHAVLEEKNHYKAESEYL